MIHRSGEFDHVRSDRRASGADELRALVDALLRAEREVAETRDRARVASGLLDASTTIAAARSKEHVAVALLRAARQTLGYRRAMWLEVEETGVVVLRHVVDDCDVVEAADDVIEFDVRMASDHRRGRPATGLEGELGAPFVDVRAAYVLSPIYLGERIAALAYLDGPPGERIEDDDLAGIASLSEIASTTLQSIDLLERTQVLANRDALTGLYNRRAFAERLSERLTRGRSVPFVFAIIDVDDFKAINDARGHAVGDAVLKRLARTLLASSRAEDTVGRYAGDEFVVALDAVDASDADRMVGRLSAHLRGAGISCSIGAACFPADADSSDALFSAADRALYVAKARGKNRHAMSASGHERAP